VDGSQLELYNLNRDPRKANNLIVSQPKRPAAIRKRMVTQMTTRMTARTAERSYRLWLARNLTGGYWSHFEPETSRRRQATTSVR
jgi:hypothetical protein